jgi:sulfide:quinone oxidoreductase
VVPPGVSWPLPAYELALMTARRAAEQGVAVDVTLITPEDRALGIFGGKASRDVHFALNAAGITLECGAVASVPQPGRVVVAPGGKVIECDHVVALSVCQGPWITGLPADSDGFLPIDLHGRVGGVERIHACGDGTNFPLKQGGIACQQADAAASWIASEIDPAVTPEPFRPVLRGQLFTGAAPQFMRRAVSGRVDHEDETSKRPLWWPPTKVAGKYLSNYLAGQDATAVEQSQIRVRRIALTQALDGLQEIPLRGYEFAARWTA